MADGGGDRSGPDAGVFDITFNIWMIGPGAYASLLPMFEPLVTTALFVLLGHWIMSLTGAFLPERWFGFKPECLVITLTLFIGLAFVTTTTGGVLNPPITAQNWIQLTVLGLLISLISIGVYSMLKPLPGIARYQSVAQAVGLILPALSLEFLVFTWYFEYRLGPPSIIRGTLAPDAVERSWIKKVHPVISG